MHSLQKRNHSLVFNQLVARQFIELQAELLLSQVEPEGPQMPFVLMVVVCNFEFAEQLRVFFFVESFHLDDQLYCEISKLARVPALLESRAALALSQMEFQFL